MRGPRGGGAGGRDPLLLENRKAGGPMMAGFYCYSGSLSPHQLKILSELVIYCQNFLHPRMGLFLLTKFYFYQSPLILTELFQHNLINVFYLTACYLYQVMMTLHFLNDVANDAESTQKSTITS